MTVLMPDKVVVRGPDRFVKGDNRTQMVWFTVPRYRDGVDLSGLGWLIHIRNAAGVETTAQPVDGTPEVRTDKIMIGWLVHGAATAAAGDMTFSLRGAGNDDAGNPMRWCSGDEVRPVCDAQESFSSSDSEAPVTVLEQLVQLVQVELPEVRDAAEAAAASANAAANTASDQADRAQTAAGNANTAAGNANTAANNANAAARTAGTASEAASDAADAANNAAGSAEAAAANAVEAKNAADNAAFKANAAAEQLGAGLKAAGDALKKAEEAERIAQTNESLRVANENSRRSAEESRASAESKRNNAESVRASKENERMTNESYRNSQESMRRSAEVNRVDAENKRATAESARRTSEDNRVAAEKNRAAAEADRLESETRRAGAEVLREAAENERTAVYTEQKIASDAATTAATLAAKNAQDAADAVGAAVYNKAPVVVSSAAGEMIAVHDASDMPLHGLRLFGKTTQNGAPSPDAPVELVNAGEGGSIGVTVCGRNLQTYPYVEKTKTQNGITFTVMDDGTVIANGTATAGTYFRFSTADSPISGLEVGKSYIFSACPKGGAYNTYCARMLIDGKTTAETGSGIEFVAGSINYAYIYIAVNITVNNVVFKPMIRLATDTDETYEPFKSYGNLTLSTPNGLPGIPVTSEGNYIDANGQRWICDEIDLERGVYIQRVAKFVATGADGWTGPMAGINEGLYGYQLKAANIDGYYKNAQAGLCSHLPKSSNYKQFEGVTFGTNLTVTVADYALRSDWEAFLVDQFASGTPVTFLYRLAEDVETPLADEEIIAYAALRTNKPNTNVLNDSGAGMQLDYAADTKIYIDNKFAALAAAMIANA